MHAVEGKVAVVTGGANGIGRGIVEALLDEGARVVVADIEAPVLDKTVGELRDRGEISGVRTDVSDFASLESLAKTVFDRYGACHLLFNNAGVTSGGGGSLPSTSSTRRRRCSRRNTPTATSTGCPS